MGTSSGADGAEHPAFERVGTADARTAARFRDEFSQWFRSQFTFDDERCHDVVLAVNEALANAAEFAYVGCDHHGTMSVSACHRPATDSLTVTVSDAGSWLPRSPGSRPSTRGRGIPLMEALADRATIARLPTGTRVELRFDGCHSEV